MEENLETSPPPGATQLQPEPSPELQSGSDLGAAIDGATAKTVVEHVRERSKGGRPPGRKDARPRKPRGSVSMGGLGELSDAALLEEMPSNGLPGELQTDPAFDDQFYETLAEGIAGAFEDLSKLVAKTVIARAGGSKQDQKDTADECAMSERNRKMIVIGGTHCLKKYLQTQHGPEAMCIAGIALHVVGVTSVVKAGKSKLEETRKDN
jgi:hypothetical protein